MPTFGPCFLNMYGSPREYSELPTRLDELNLGRVSMTYFKKMRYLSYISNKICLFQGEGVAYRGRVLFEVQTILGELPTEPIADIKSAEIARIEPFLHRKKFKLNAAFLDATMISMIEKPIEFEVSIGNKPNF